MQIRDQVVYWRFSNGISDGNFPSLKYSVSKSISKESNKKSKWFSDRFSDGNFSSLNIPSLNPSLIGQTWSQYFLVMALESVSKYSVSKSIFN